MKKLSKQLGKRLFLRNLIFTHRSISRPELIRLCGLNARSVDRYTHELKALGLIRSTQVQGSRGRPATAYTSNSENCLFVGAVIDSWQLLTTVLDINGKPMFCQAIPCPRRQSLANLETDIIVSIERATQQSGQQVPYAICLGLPTHLDQPQTRARLLQALRNRYRTQVECLSTDTLITHEALAHTWLNGRIASIIFSSAFIIFDNGLHVTQYNKRLQALWHRRTPEGLGLNLACSCGKRGCLQAELSGEALIERYRQLAGATPGNTLLAAGKNINLEAKLGNQNAINTIRAQAEVYGYLASQLHTELPVDYIIMIQSSHFNNAAYAQFASEAFARWSGVSPHQFRPYAYSWADMAFAASQYARRNFAW